MADNADIKSFVKKMAHAQKGKFHKIKRVLSFVSFSNATLLVQAFVILFF